LKTLIRLEFVGAALKYNNILSKEQASNLRYSLIIQSVNFILY